MLCKVHAVILIIPLLIILLSSNLFISLSSLSFSTRGSNPFKRSINLSELKSMCYKPFVVGLIAAVTVGFISLIYIETILKFFI